MRTINISGPDGNAFALMGYAQTFAKQLGIDSRKDMEEFVGKKVHLDLFVKVDEGWRDKSGKLKKYGY